MGQHSMQQSDASLLLLLPFSLPAGKFVCFAASIQQAGEAVFGAAQADIFIILEGMLIHSPMKATMQNNNISALNFKE